MGKQLITQVGPGASPYRYSSLTLLENLTSGRSIKRWLRNSLVFKEHESPKTSSILNRNVFRILLSSHGRHCSFGSFGKMFKPLDWPKSAVECPSAEPQLSEQGPELP